MNNNIINDYIKIFRSIYNVYLDLAKYEYKGNKEKYLEELELLKMCTDIENKFYKKLNIDEENNIIDKLLRKIDLSKYNDNIKYSMMERLNNYIFIEDYLNPFLSMGNNITEHQNMSFNKCDNILDFINSFVNEFVSMTADRMDRDIENIFVIDIQYDISYIRTFIKVIDKYIDISDNKLKKELCNYKYETMYKWKVIEYFLFNEQNKKIRIEEREKCLLFGHNKDTVNKIFKERTNDMLDECLNEILNINSFNTLNNLDNTKMRIRLETLFSLLTKYEFGSFCHSVYEHILINPDFDNDAIRLNLSFLNEVISNYAKSFEKNNVLVKRK